MNTAATIDLNANMGERYGRWDLGDDAGVMEPVASVNVASVGVATGYHAGDPSTRRATVDRAVELDLCIGAHVAWPGKLQRFEPPGGPGVRVETGFVAGDVVSPYYDSLLAKIVVWGADREQAFAGAGRALDELVDEGVATTVSLHRRRLSSDDLLAGPVTTRWSENWL